MATHENLTDAEVLEAHVSAIAEDFGTVVARGWEVSERATILAVARCLATLVLQHLAQHPSHHTEVVTMLHRLLDYVSTTTGTRH